MRSAGIRWLLLSAILGVIVVVAALWPHPARPGPAGQPAAAGDIGRWALPSLAKPLAVRGGVVVTGHVTGVARHAYHVRLSGGSYLALKVDAGLPGVAVRVLDPSGREVLVVPAPDAAGGSGRIDVIASAPGSYAVEIRPQVPAADATYTARVEHVRPAGERDRRATHATRVFTQAETLAMSGAATDLRRAVSLYRQALGVWRKLEWREREALTLQRLADAYLVLRDLDVARRAYEQARRLQRALGNKGAEARLLAALGPALRLLGRPGDAAACYRQALALATQAGDRVAQAEALVNWGVLRDSQGDAEGALDLYDPALQLWDALHASDRRAGVLQAIGSAYTLLGRTDEALDVLRQALQAHAEPVDERRRAGTLMLIGSAYVAADEPGRALESFSESIELFRRAGDEVGTTVAKQRRGWALLKQRRFLDAVRAFEDALGFFEARRVPLEQLNCLASLAVAWTPAGRPDRAHAAARKALRLLAAWRRDPVTEASIRLADARALAALGRSRGSEAQAAAALALVEGGRAQVRSRALRSSYLAVRQDYYDFAVELLMRQHALAPATGTAVRALEIAERGRARALLDGLAESRQSARDDARRQRTATIKAQINSLDRRRIELLRGAADATVLGNLDARLSALLRELDRVDDRTGAGKVRTPRGPEPLRLFQVQGRLDGRTTVLFYALGQARSFVWWLTRDGVGCRALPPRDHVEKIARLAYARVGRSHEWALGAPAAEALRALGRDVLWPVLNDVRGERLLIVPDGALHYIPFAALPVAPAAAGSHAGEAELLIDRYEIVTLPSLSSFASARRSARKAAPPSLGLAVLADPVFEPDDARLGIAARPRVPSSAVERATDLTRSARAAGLERFDRLPYTRVEARAILDDVAAAGNLSALDFDASRALVMSGRLRDYRILHFATHGLLNPRHPELSGLVLSRLDHEGRDLDGFLRVHDIYDLELRADLVTLSACRTALGKEVRGEGLVGLTHAFLHAGAARVLVSLWNVNDRATAKLMQHFYDGLLRRRQAPPQALRQAQLALRREPGFRAPSQWAGFVLQGDWR